MNNIPGSVIWFGITAFIAIVFALHLAHIYSIGFDAFTKEIVKKFDIPAKQAQEEARFSFWFDWVMVFGFGIAAVVSLCIIIKNMIQL